MTDLPQPLTPADCDLRGLPFMPLDVIRLLDSDMFAEATGEEFKAAVALWCKSWTQIPAASLPNKDKVLAKLSQSDCWKKVKDGAMRGWILCSDDRWYHPVVAEKALAALPGREEFNSRKSADAERKAREREDRKALFEALKSRNVVPDWNVSTKILRAMVAQYLSQEPPDDFRDQSRDMSQHVTVSKGEGERKGEGEGELTSKEEAEHHRTDSTATYSPSAVGALCIAMRAAGVETQPHDPRMMALADQGVLPETLTAACAEAKKSKPNERITPGYVLGILARWSKEAAALNVSGAAQPRASPPGYQTPNEKAKDIADRLTGKKRNEQPANRIIDLNDAPA